MPAWYANALWPDPVRCCGIRLRPLTLGHALLLQRIGSPFAREDGAGAGLGDLIAAVYVCSRSWRRAARGLNRPRWFGLWARWMAFRRWKREARDAADWAAYLRASWSAPKTWRGKDTTGVRGIDVLQLLVVTQRIRFGKPLEEALETPVAIAIMDHLESLEGGGALRVWGSRDDALASKLEEILARNREGGVGKEESVRG